ncbi:MarR family winged helix-turn-helix transcriptional regulator [Nocardioides sp.]|uniref:MarR family winged helix-turn-helix transcriptional regulator n=1 Tax=Nocardioides sp. TaxID=35761 RepID=UPI003783DE9F
MPRLPRSADDTAPLPGGHGGPPHTDECDPERCPCDDAACSLSRYARAAAAAGDAGSGEFTLEATEQAVADRLDGMAVDMAAMTAVSNIYRAANAVRNHLERTVLAEHGLTWTGWVVLWVIWIWGEVESRHVAHEAGISKGTLTGVQKTLQAKGLVHREVHPQDARRVLLSLTDEGQALMAELFPAFNAQEVFVTQALSEEAVLRMARSLRAVVKQAEGA